MESRLRYGDPQGRNSPGSQFPSKFNALPGIPLRNSPQPTHDNQMVPLSGGGYRSGMDGLDAEERIRQLETRISVTEKSNRALLEEVVRLQSELKGTVRRNEEILREERQARNQMENGARAANDIMSQIGARLKRTEEKLQEERSAVSALVNHTKSVEQAVLGSQQELVSRRDLQAAKLEELRNELNTTVRAKDQLERALYNVVDEMRQMKGRMESQNMDFSAVTVDLKNKAKKLEEDNRQHLDQIRKQGETHNQTEQTTSQLRAQIENRLSELRDVLVDLRNKQDGETQERRMLEQTLQLKMNELSNSIGEQNRKREEAMHALDSIAREKEHAAESERLRLQAKISEIAEEVSKKILNKEIKLRDEAQQKFSKVEKLMHAEQQARLDHEKNNRDEFEKRWESFKRLTDDEIQQVRDINKLDRRKASDTLTKLDESLSILEQQSEEHKKQSDRIIAAEIKSRKGHEKATNDKIADVQEKLSMATTTLQQAIGGTVIQMQKQNDKLKKDVKAMVEEGREAQTRDMEALQKRLEEITEQISDLQEHVKTKMSSNSNAATKAMQAKLDSIAEWQTTMKKTVKEMQTNLQQIPEDIYAVEEKFEDTKSNMSIKIDEEREEREREFENLKKEVSRLIHQAQAQQPIKGKAAPATLSDLDNVHASIRKLAESVQTVKTVLGMKIQSESKARDDGIKKLTQELELLRERIEPLMNAKPLPKLFIKTKEDKADPEEAEKNALEINKWTIANAYSWLFMKSKWDYIRWKQATRPKSNGSENNNNNLPVAPLTPVPHSRFGRSPTPSISDPKRDASPPAETPPNTENKPSQSDPKEDGNKNNDTDPGGSNEQPPGGSGDDDKTLSSV